MQSFHTVCGKESVFKYCFSHLSELNFKYYLRGTCMDFFLRGTCMLPRYTQGIRSLQMSSVDICSELTLKVLTADREVQAQVVWTRPWLPHGPERLPEMVFRTNCQGNDSGTDLTVAVQAAYLYIHVCIICKKKLVFKKWMRIKNTGIHFCRHYRSHGFGKDQLQHKHFVIVLISWGFQKEKKKK